MEQQIQDIIKMARAGKAGELLPEHREDVIAYLCDYYTEQDAAVLDRANSEGKA